MAKKRIQREIRLIIILAVLSVIFFGLTFGIKAMEGHKEDENKRLTELATMAELPDRVEVTDCIRPFVLESEGSSWYLSGDREVPISDLQVTDTRAVAKYFAPGRIITDGRDKWQDFGLNDPQCVTALKSGTKEITYLIGNYNPVTNEYYVAAEGNDTVYMISKKDGDSLKKSIFDYVEGPGILNTTFTDIEGIRIESEDGIYNIDLENGRYMVNTPDESFETDQSKVMAIFNCFTTSGDYHCTEFASASNGSPNDFGLDDPAVKVFFTMKDSKGEYDMYIGRGADGGCYIAENAKNIIYSFNEKSFETLMEDIKISSLR